MVIGKTIKGTELMYSSKMELERLYKIDSNGKKRIWYVVVHPDRYVTYTGMVGGKIQEKEYPVEASDNGNKKYRKQEDKALFKAQSAWNSKRTKGGMVTESELSEGGDVKSIYPISPILAHPYKGIDGLTNGTGEWLVQYKYDGLRCIASLVGGNVELHSRGRKEWPFLPLIRDEGKKILSCLPPGWHLDGELYVHGKSTEYLISLVRGEGGKPHQDNNIVTYMVYDLVDPDGRVLGSDRQRLLKALIPPNRFDRIRLAPIIGTIEANKEGGNPSTISDEKIQQLLKDAEGDGYEGIMLRGTAMIYKRGLGIRSPLLLKVKNFKDEEVTIIGCDKGKAAHEGCMVFEVMTDTGHKLYVSSHGSLEHRKLLWQQHESEEKKFIGLRYTIKYKELNPYGVPKFAVGVGFRDPADE